MSAEIARVAAYMTEPLPGAAVLQHYTAWPGWRVRDSPLLRLNWWPSNFETWRGQLFERPAARAIPHARDGGIVWFPDVLWHVSTSLAVAFGKDPRVAASSHGGREAGRKVFVWPDEDLDLVAEWIGALTCDEFACLRALDAVAGRSRGGDDRPVITAFCRARITTAG